MHEFSIASSIAHQLAELAQQHHRKLLSATVAIGPLSTVVPELLSEAWPHVIKGTDLEGATLHIKQMPVHARCNECSTVTEEYQPFVKCCKCGSLDLSIESGFELQILSAELADSAEEAGNS